MKKNFASTNPWTGTLLEEYPYSDAAQQQAALAQMDRAQKLWQQKSLEARLEPLGSLAQVFLENKERYAVLMAQEMGKPVTQGIAEIEKCARLLEYYKCNAPVFLKEQKISSLGLMGTLTYAPLGIILAIMPWNFPFWQAFRAAIPALLGGNGFLLKPSTQTPACGLAFESAFIKAGFPEGLAKTLFVSHEDLPALISDERIQGVTLTGSARAGKIVAALAGKSLKKMVLELGGSDPYIILEDAKLGHAARTCVLFRMLNAGQSCISPKRIIVHEKVYEPFMKEVLRELKKYVPQDPLDPKTVLGPLASNAFCEDVHSQVLRTVAAGARLLCGGKLSEGPGALYAPTLLADLNTEDSSWYEEIFGPIVGVVSAPNLETALKLANDSPYGLGGGVFTENPYDAEAVCKAMHSGLCAINTCVQSDPSVPFGGVKHSGFGRELGAFGLYEFANIKTVVQTL